MSDTLLIARLYEHIEPLDRGSRYEDPLDAVLRTAGAGKVTGGGSQLGQFGEIEFVDVEMRVASLDDALPLVVESLERSGAPVESELIGEAGVLRRFGTQQSLAVYLDGMTLPAQVYAELDFSEVVRAMGKAAGEGSYRTFWQGPAETAVFFFGVDAEQMFARVEPLLRALPIGQNARMVIRASKDPSAWRTVRLPRS